MNVIFMGTPDYAKVILERLVNNKDINIIAVFTQPDKKVGRKQEIKFSDVKQFIIDNELDIPIYQPQKLSTYVEIIKNLKPDFIVVAAYGQILSKDILEIAPCINLHASILPKYRGASPIHSAILNRDTFTGVTAMLMNEGLDTGDILSYQFTKIEDKNIIDLFDELAVIAAELTEFTLFNFNTIKPLKQNDVFASYSPKLKKEDGFVDFEDALEVYTKFKAFLVWPNIFDDKYKYVDIKLNEYTSSNNKGDILEITDEYFVLGCTKGSIKVYKIQPKSKKVLTAKDFINGRRLKVGDNLFR